MTAHKHLPHCANFFVCESKDTESVTTRTHARSADDLSRSKKITFVLLPRSSFAANTFTQSAVVLSTQQRQPQQKRPPPDHTLHFLPRSTTAAATASPSSPAVSSTRTPTPNTTARALAPTHTHTHTHFTCTAHHSARALTAATSEAEQLYIFWPHATGLLTSPIPLLPAIVVHKRHIWTQSPHQGPPRLVLTP
ncbi:hypothetical protein PTSG_10919 [Salpingoeca rosetta]|uniref:Uncharacterized protein n=1 Tax=Salpingoeca rosetta (strain ATCC 50818 / BSB-021) TaxID=946362 RepID=F2URE0_SALR5|nr:uncharacterized protein PTSG_10919 [Salpingoeca rosetta]EGD80243.1 hypothetical protein PTSG_10919 [Salpingoeca rosetta]|eukprot:XP_004988305.1 hypothetical protein PTSG_10919 [Salpingoeca rosetta]